jgi:hypothetical protein
MKQSGVISAAVLLLLLATTSLVYAQHEQQGQGKEQGKSQQGQQHPQGQSGQGQHQQQGQPQHTQQAQAQHTQPAQPQGRPQQSYGGAYHGGVKPNAPAYGGVHPSGVPQHSGQVHSGFQQSRSPSWNDNHRTWAQRGGYNGYRVPDDRFRLYFGSNHYFRIYGLPLVFVGGYPRFQYDGYWVTFVDPWPETWPDTWYQTDDVYLDYTNDGYYVYDRTRPGPGIAVTISF